MIFSYRNKDIKAMKSVLKVHEFIGKLISFPEK